MNPTTNAIIATMERAKEALDEALTTHIYNAESGEKPDPGCQFVEARDSLFMATDSARRFGAFTYLEMEAALCVWECINDWTVNADKQDEGWTALRQSVGSVEMRHASIPLGVWCLAVFDLCTKDDRDFFDGIAYDWEVIPMILDHCRDAEGAPVIEQAHFPATQIVAPKVMARHRQNEWMREARGQAEVQWAYADLITDHPEAVQAAIEAGEDPAKFVRELGEDLSLIPNSEW